MNPPYLTPRGETLLPAMADKVRESLDDVCADGAAPSRIPRSNAFCARILGCAISPKLDPNDEILREVVGDLEGGALSPDERTFFDRELNRMTGTAVRVMRPATVEGLSPTDIRAVLLADFVNGRTEEGTLGENLHIGARRVFERYYKFFDGAQSIANRSGFYKPSDLFQPAYRVKVDGGKAPINDLSPNMPGETTPVARNRMKAY